MKTMQEMQAKQASKDRTCTVAWHQDRQADFRVNSKGFSQEDVSEPSRGKGAF